MLLGDKIQSTVILRLATLMSSSLRKRELQRQARSRRSPPRAGEAGNVFFTLFGAVAVVGVLGAGIMSTMRGPLTTMVEVNRIEEAKAQSRMNARLILLEAGGNDTHCGSADDVGAGGTIEFTEAVPFAAGAGPTGGGVIPSSVDGAKNDPWGNPYGYCVWNNGAGNTGCANTIDGADNLNAPAVAIVSGGADRQITTTCAQAGALDIQGDDIVETLTYSEAVSASGGLWTDSGATIDSGKALNVTDTTNNSSFGAGATFGGNVTLDPAMTLSAPNVTTDVITGLTGGTVELSANTTVSGTLTLTGDISDSNGDVVIADGLTVSGTNPTTLTGTLNVTGDTTVAILNATGAVDFDSTLNVGGSITDIGDNIVTIDDDLDVTGAGNITGNFSVNTNMFTVDGTTGNTVVAGTADLNGKTIIRGDGTDETTNALEIWNADTTPLELLTVTDAGDLTIAGTLDIGTGITINGAADARMVLIADDVTGEFLPQNIEGDVTISDEGDVQIVAGAVTTTEILDNTIGVDDIGSNAVDTDELADGAVTGAKIGLGVAGAGTYDCLKLDGSTIITQACGSGGGGDGVGTDGFTDLADTPANYTGTTAGDLVVVNATTNGLEFVDAATVIPANDRIEDAPDVTDSNAIDTYIDVDTTDNGQTNSIVFYTNGTERMTIDNAGLLTVREQSIFNAVATLANGIDESQIYVRSGNPSIGIRDTGSSNGWALRTGTSGTFSIASQTESDAGTAHFLINTDGRMAVVTSALDDSAAFQINSTGAGFLAPRLTNAEATTLAGVPPATGLLIFNTDAGDAGIFQFWDGSAWVDVGGGGAETGGLWEPDGTNDFIEYDDTLGGVRIGRVTGQPAPATDWLLDVTNSVVYTTTNKVGINSSTISTGLELDVTGNIGATNYCDQDGGDCFDAGDIATLVGGGGAQSDRIQDSDANEPSDTYIDVDTTDDGLTESIVFVNAGTQTMILDSVGLGIGVPASANTELHLHSSGTYSSLTFTNAASGTTASDGAEFGLGNTLFNIGVNENLPMAFWTNASERMRISAAGLVGIGNTDPQTALDVTGTIKIGNGTETCLIPAHEGAIRYLAGSDTYEVCANSATGWEPLFTGGSGAAGLWTDLGGGRIHYGDDGTQQVGIGTALPTSALDVLGDIRANSLRLNPISGDAPTYITDLMLDDLSDVIVPTPSLDDVLTWDGSYWVPLPNSSGLWSESGSDIYFTSGNVGIGNAIPTVALDVDGDIQYTGTITDVSDIRLKSDIAPLDPADMINRISEINTYSFLMKGAKDRRFEYGVMAQELESIFPNLVHTADDEMGTKSVNYVGLIAPIVGAIQALRVDDAALSRRIDEHIKALSVENQSLKAQLRSLAEQTLLRHGELSLERDDLDAEVLALEESVASLQEEVVAIGKKEGYASFSLINDIRILLAIIFSVAVGLLLGYCAPRAHRASPD